MCARRIVPVAPWQAVVLISLVLIALAYYITSAINSPELQKAVERDKASK